MPQTPMRKRPLPHAANRLFLAEGGMETVMIFRKGIELPAFSSIELVRTFAGRAQLEFYYETYLSIARATGLGLILDTATWRASPDWQTAIGFPDRATLAEAHRMAVRQIESLRADNERADSPILISGTIGPRGDGYSPDMTMTTKQAEDYHAWQMDVFAGTAVDLVTALTIPTVNEAVGIARAARRHAMPLALSFTAETDGRLPSGVPLAEAIEATDAATGAAPIYYMVNCAHPDHIARALGIAGDWVRRIGGLRANASRCSHAELDGCETLDDGDPCALAADLWSLRAAFPNATVLGGCCGTDHRHIAELARTCLAHGASRHRHAAE